MGERPMQMNSHAWLIRTFRFILLYMLALRAVPAHILCVYFPVSFSVSTSFRFIMWNSFVVFLHLFYPNLLCTFVCVLLLNFPLCIFNSFLILLSLTWFRLMQQFLFLSISSLQILKKVNVHPIMCCAGTESWLVRYFVYFYT